MIINLEKIKDREAKAALKSNISNPKKFADLLRGILKAEQKIDQDREHFWAAGLDSKNHIIYFDLTSLGTRTSTIIHPAEVYHTAISRGAAGLLTGHNHPSGDPAPSGEDIKLTNRLSATGKTVGIELLDHVIVGDPGYYSFAASGLLNAQEKVKDCSESKQSKKDISQKPMVIVEYADDGWDELHVEKCDLASLKSVHGELSFRGEIKVKRMDFIENGYHDLENDVQYFLMQIHDIAGIAQELMADQGDEMRSKLYVPVYTLAEVLSDKISTVRKYLDILELRNTHEVVEKEKAASAGLGSGGD